VVNAMHSRGLLAYQNAERIAPPSTRRTAPLT
jgi:hypothetical protein